MSTALESQRTYAIVGTGGCGKTSLAEMLLLQAGVINRLGKIEEGTTALDFEPEEIKRRGSIQPAFASINWKGARHYFMDLPGDGNFTGDMDVLLSAADFAVFTLDAVDGVRPLTKKHWQAVIKAGIPACCFINKLDRDRADFKAAYDGLSILGIKPVLLYAPIGSQADFKGVVDVLGGKALMFDANGGVTEAPVPADMQAEITSLRENAIENIAESDEELMEKYLEEGELPEADIISGLRKGVLGGELVPVMAGSALENKGGALLLDIVSSYLPSPLDRGNILDENAEELKVDPKGPTVLFICKTVIDPFSGLLNIARVMTGSVNSESSLKNSRNGETERLGTPILLTGKNQNPTKETLGPGSLIAIAKLKNTKTGDTLSDKGSFVIPMPGLPPQLISYAVSPKEKGDEEKVYSALQKLTDEDITLKLSRDEETGEIILSGMGQLHIEIAVERAKRRYKVDIVLNTPKVPYRETFKGKAQVQGRHKKQTGGRGQFGDCWVEFESLPKGEGYVFEDAIVGGSIPRQYIPAVDKGIQESAARGFLSGYPMVDFKAKLYDGSFHNVDSSEMAFKIAGSLAFKKAMESCKPVLLEPIVTLTISIPDEYMGDVIGDLSSRRGKVLGSDSVSGITELKAHVPMSEILRYAPDLRSMTSGQGIFTAEFSHYEEAPAPVMEKVVAEYQQHKKDDD